MLVLAWPGQEALARSLATALGCPQAPLWMHQFPDGESLVRIEAAVAGQDVLLACSLDHPDDKALPLLFAAGTAQELGARRVGLVAPYLAYMRQDIRFRPGEAVTSSLFAALLSEHLDFLATVDPHLHRWNSLDQIYTIPTRAVAAAPSIATWIRDNMAQPLIVGPDEESQQWVAEVARHCDAPWTVLHKTRLGDRKVEITLPTPALGHGLQPVLVDDIGSTGHTLARAAEAVQAAGFEAPAVITVHALFEPSAGARLWRAGVRRVVSCNTVTHPSNGIDVLPDLAGAVREMLSAGEPRTSA